MNIMRLILGDWLANTRRTLYSPPLKHSVQDTVKNVKISGITFCNI